MKFKSITDQWQHFGNYYGYPKCCIDSFCNQRMTRSQRRAGNGSGFIPCKKHSRLILLRETTLKDLIRNRIHTKPFRN